MPRELRYCRPKSQPPVTLLSYLATKFTYLSHEAWEHHLEAGHVFVNGFVHHTGDTLLEQGDLLRFAPPRSLEPAVDEEHIVILYEDASLVVCAKNGNLPVAEGGRYCENTLVGVLQRRGVAAFHTADTVTCGAAVSSTELLDGDATAEAGSGSDTLVVNAAEEMPPTTEVQNGLASHGKRSRESTSSISIETPSLQAKPPSFFTVQRLDKETSGVLVLCKTSSTARDIASQLESQTSRCSAAVEAHLVSFHSASFSEKDFEAILEQSSKTVRKTYTAVLCGAAPPGQVMIVVNSMGTMQSHPVFAHDPAHTQLKKLKMCSEPLSAQRLCNTGGGTGGASCTQWGKVACTRVRVLASSASLNLFCVEVTLLTGRSHQIRVHCASLGYPIVGDKLYTCVTPGVVDGCVAVSDAVYLARVRDEENPYVTVENGAVEGHRMACRRHLLHATELCFEHPDVSGGPAKRFAASPTDFFLRDVRFDAAEDADSFEALLREAFSCYEH